MRQKPRTVGDVRLQFSTRKPVHAGFDKTGMRELRLGVEQDWMLMIAFFRGKLTAYENHPMIRRILNRLNGIDYVVAPIADNRMFQIIDSFIEGEITDVQCQHCLSATNLGNQYVFLTQRAADPDSGSAQMLSGICRERSLYFSSKRGYGCQ